MLPLLALAASMQGDTTVTLSRGSTVEITSPMGDVVIRAGRGDEVSAPGGRVAVRGSRLVIERGWLSHSRLTVTVPAWAALKVTSVEGDIAVEGVDGTITLESINGDVRIRGGRGTVDATSISGDVTIDGVSGAIATSSVQGDVTLAGVRSASVNANTTNGDVRFDGTPLPQGRYILGTHNGDVTIVVPRELDARLDLTLMHGEFTTSLPGRTTGNRAPARPGQPQEYTVTYGGGGARIRAEVFNGSVRLTTR